MTWGFDFVKSIQERSERLAQLKIVCSKLTQEIDIKRSCVEASSISVMVTNSGAQNISALNFLVEGEKGRDHLQNYSGVPKAGIKHYILPFKPKKTGLPTKIKITPATMIDDRQEFCEFSVDHDVNECAYGITRDVWGTLYDAKEKNLFTICIPHHTYTPGPPSWGYQDSGCKSNLTGELAKDFWTEGIGGGVALNLSIPIFEADGLTRYAYFLSSKNQDLGDYSELTLESWIKLSNEMEYGGKINGAVLWDGLWDGVGYASLAAFTSEGTAAFWVWTEPKGSCTVNGYKRATQQPWTATKGNLTSKKWHHLVGVYKGNIGSTQGYVRLYIDGKKVAEETFTDLPMICNPTVPFKIGSYLVGNVSNTATGGSAYYSYSASDMLIDSAVVYNRSLSEEEILAHYNYKKQFL